jgi:hypothetical protein
MGLFRKSGIKGYNRADFNFTFSLTSYKLKEGRVTVTADFFARIEALTHEPLNPLA